MIVKAMVVVFFVAAALLVTTPVKADIYECKDPATGRSTWRNRPCSVSESTLQRERTRTFTPTRRRQEQPVEPAPAVQTQSNEEATEATEATEAPAAPERATGLGQVDRVDIDLASSTGPRSRTVEVNLQFSYFTAEGLPVSWSGRVVFNCTLWSYPQGYTLSTVYGIKQSSGLLRSSSEGVSYRISRRQAFKFIEPLYAGDWDISTILAKAGCSFILPGDERIEATSNVITLAVK